MRAKEPKGLTLIELMVALAIAALLTTAVLGVTGRLLRAEVLNRRAAAGLSRTSGLEYLLEMDLLHAQRFRCRDNGFELQSVAALRAEDLETAHLGSLVRYEVREIAGRSWLVRTQQSVAAGDFTRLVCSGVKAVSLRPAKGERAVRSSRRWRPVPERVIVTATFADGDRRELSLCFYTR